MNSGDDFPEGASRRRLVAILAADIVGYSRLMGADEEGTLARVKRHRREIIEPTIADHHGRLIKTTGDGILVMFDSPLEAVRCAIVIQQSVAARNAGTGRSQWVQYRMGVNLGDVIVDPDDIYGDGVNIAARLESLAEPGSVFISGGVYEQIKNKLVCGYKSLGDEKLKNITDPVRIYQVLPDPASIARARPARWAAASALGSFLVVAGVVGWYTWRADQAPSAEGRSAPAASAPAQQTARVEPDAAQVAASRPADAAKPQAADVERAREIVLPLPSPTPSRPPPELRSELPSPAAPLVAAPSLEPAVAAPPPAAPSREAALTTPPPDAAPAPAPDPSRDCPQCPTMVDLPGGTFAMGSNDDPTEKPVRQVTVAPFALGRFPVTVGEWKVCVAAKACNFAVSGEDDEPVREVSWNDALEYVAWLSKKTGRKYRLPTEAEWEYSARGGTGTKFWWGNQLVAGLAGCRGCGEPYDPKKPKDVGSFRPNPFGLHDMAGGVAQWVADCWRRDYQGAPRDGSAWTEPNCRERVLRGGSWRNDPNYLRTASRDHYDGSVRYLTHGFRVARSQ